MDAAVKSLNKTKKEDQLVILIKRDIPKMIRRDRKRLARNFIYILMSTIVFEKQERYTTQ